MKILTNDQYEKMLRNERNQGREEGYNYGLKEGYKQGLHKGLTQNEEGVFINNNGMYLFEDGKEERKIFK
ncbi:hypothetical protein Pryu01_02427 [Paraliobacillus ryukyuensis]|uniref:hypothetical protein n=1 Tax=Paraliobacillus ryukyuensis TaxID=200904 RepID=UPI0030A42F53